jgi:AraC-like DNA-binding protein
VKSRLVVREADSALVQAVAQWTIGDEGRSVAAPDGCWDLVVLNQGGATRVLLTGQTTRAVTLDFAPGDDILTISFKASAFLPFIPAPQLLDRGLLLPSAGRRFQLAGDVFDIPHFDNVEEFVHSLARKQQISQDAVVEALRLDRPPAYSLRSIQRRFRRATGLTYSSFRQIRRARQAATLLQGGLSAVDAALQAGYADQPHMTRSLKQILGETPTEIVTLHDL